MPPNPDDPVSRLTLDRLDEHLAAAMAQGTCLAETRAVLRREGQLWFNDESFSIDRKRNTH